MRPAYTVGAMPDVLAQLTRKNASLVPASIGGSLPTWVRDMPVWATIGLAFAVATTYKVVRKRRRR